MNFQQYLDCFDLILTNTEQTAPYDKTDYLNYAKLNWSRLNRWIKKGMLSHETQIMVRKITTSQKWIVITEHWCGDAAHIIPFLNKMADLNPLIHIDYELRDSEPFRIESYLTNGTKSIPKLIIKDDQGQDLAVWGPRPAQCQSLFQQLKAAHVDYDTLKTELQKWYNQDEGVQIQLEICAILDKLSSGSFDL